MAGRIARVLSFIRSVRQGANIPQIKAEVAAEEIKDCDHYQDAGDDSPPLPEDYTVLVAGLRTGILNAVGFVDTINAGLAEPGEKRIYSRDSSGAVVAALWLQGDGTIILDNADGKVMLQPGGTIVIENASGTIEIQPGGTIDINGVTITPAGLLNAGGAILSPTGTVTTALGADLDIVKAKINEIIGIHNTHTHGAGPVPNPPPMVPIP